MAVVGRKIGSFQDTAGSGPQKLLSVDSQWITKSDLFCIWLSPPGSEFLPLRAAQGIAPIEWYFPIILLSRPCGEITIEGVVLAEVLF